MSGSDRLRVQVLTPRGQGGTGGVDRLMDALRPLFAAPSAIAVAFVTTRGLGRRPSVLIAGLAMARLALASAFRRVDVIHVNLGAYGSFYRKLAMIAAPRLLNTPYVLHLHGSAFDRFWKTAPAPIRQRIDRLFHDAAAIIVLGETWRALVLSHLPALSSKIVVLPNASRPIARRADPDRKEVVLLFLGELGQRKGAPILLQALSRLTVATSWRAVIAGDGDLAAMQSEIDRLGLTHKVVAPGWVGPDVVEDLLATSDILVSPSMEENLPMAVIEAFAAGLAVIATPVGALPDILQPGKTGLFVAPGHVDDLETALQALIDDPSFRARLGAAARAYHADHLALDVYADRLIDVWRSAAR